MYKKILVAYDGSSFSDMALRQGFDLARLCNAELHLVGIVATTTTGVAIAGEAIAPVDIWTTGRKALEEALDAAVRKLSGQGVNPGTSIREGSPANEIAACAEELNADVVVIGHSDKGVLARWFEGSVGAGLLRHLPCDLLVATGKE